MGAHSDLKQGFRLYQSQNLTLTEGKERAGRHMVTIAMPFAPMVGEYSGQDQQRGDRTIDQLSTFIKFPLFSLNISLFDLHLLVWIR